MTCRLHIKALIAELDKLEHTLAEKTQAFAHMLKLGRTCLQDAVPMTFGQQFSGYQAQVKRLKDMLTTANQGALSLPLGGTAVGTGLATFEGYLDAVYADLQDITGEKYIPEENFFDGMQNGDFYLEISSQLKKLAAFLSKLATDLRIQGSGPRAGFNELIVPAVQPGSSIMPGKINPVIPELVNQVAYQVIGNDVTITMAVEGGELDLNIWEPIIIKQPGSSIMPGKINPVIPELVNQVAYQVIGNDVTITMAVEGGELDLNIWEPIIIKALFESCTLLTNVIPIFINKCLKDLQVNEQVSRRYAEESTALATVIATLFGYQTGSSVAKAAHKKGCTVKDVVLEQKLLTPEQAEYLLDPMSMTDPHKSAAAIKRYQKEVGNNLS